MDSSEAYRSRYEQVVEALGVDARLGLAGAEAERRIVEHGLNTIPAAPPIPTWRRLLAQFQDPLILLLVAAAVISTVAWWMEGAAGLPYETLAIVAIVALNGVLGYVQEERAERAVAALQAMAVAEARVVRDGRIQHVPTSEVVPGDVLSIEEGDAIPADARLIESIALRVAEAALTGESTPVTKDSNPIPTEVGLADRGNMVFRGTAVASGRGRAVVVATGARTELGKIADALQHTKEEKTPLQKELGWVGKRLGLAVIGIAVIVAVTLVVVGHVQSVEGAIQVLLVAVSLAVAAVPEGLPAITTVTLSLGVQRMALRRVIVRKLSAVETLGSTSVICTDKTGTLTKNEMTVRVATTSAGRVELTGIGYAPHGEALLDGEPVHDEAHRLELRALFSAATLANNADLVERDGKPAIQGDPTEGALVVAAYKVGLTEQGVEDRFPRIGEVPFTSERKMMSTVHRDDEGDARLAVASKGAPDVLLARCQYEQVGEEVRPLTAQRREAILRAVDGLAGEALRTLGVAYRHLALDTETGEWTEDIEREFVFLGVVGIQDPPREEARTAVADAHAAGIRVVMITGDHPKMAARIASELDIGTSGEESVTGRELAAASEVELDAIVRDHQVYARVAPDHKLRIVKALKRQGRIVAMTGDGVNDAPALKAADIGVAMGITGTDVSKEASDMVLLDDNFASIVAAVEEGRAIFRSLQAALRYLLSSNTGEVLTMFLGVVFAGALGLEAGPGGALIVPLLATQILWINLLTDSGPAIALGVEPPDRDVMRQAPRNARDRVIDGAMWADILVVGVVMAAGTLFVLDWELPGGMFAGQDNPAGARTAAFTTLVFFQLFNAFNSRHASRSAFVHLGANRWLWAAVLLAIGLQVAVVYVPLLQRAFGTVAMTSREWLLTVAVASSVLWVSEAFKAVARGRASGRRGNPPAAVDTPRAAS